MRAPSTDERYDKYKNYCHRVSVPPMPKDKWIIVTECLSGDSAQRLALYENLRSSTRPRA